MLRHILAASTFTVTFTLAAASPAWSQTALPPIGAATEEAFGKLLAHTGVKQAVDFIKTDDERTLKDQIELTEVPAPPFKESVHAAEYYLKRIKRELGLPKAYIDKEGNVIGIRAQGQRQRPETGGVRTPRYRVSGRHRRQGAR